LTTAIEKFTQLQEREDAAEMQKKMLACMKT
jgi:hypothetical protein